MVCLIVIGVWIATEWLPPSLLWSALCKFTISKNKLLVMWLIRWRFVSSYKGVRNRFVSTLNSCKNEIRFFHTSDLMMLRIWLVCNAVNINHVLFEFFICLDHLQKQNAIISKQYKRFRIAASFVYLMVTSKSVKGFKSVLNCHRSTKSTSHSKVDAYH